MTRAHRLATFACPLCGHRLRAIEAAQVWCVRKSDHPVRVRGPVPMEVV